MILFLHPVAKLLPGLFFSTPKPSGDKVRTFCVAMPSVSGFSFLRNECAAGHT